MTAGQIHLQMVHRLLAVLLLGGVWGMSFQWVKEGGAGRRFALAWSGLLLVQFGLGAATIWTNKAADLATAHVVVGAASLLTGVLFSVKVLGQRVANRKDNSCPRPAPFLNTTSVASGTPSAALRSVI